MLLKKKWLRGLIVCVIGVMITCALWPAIQLNILNIYSTKALLTDESISPDLIRALINYSPASPGRLTTAGILLLKIYGEAGIEQATQTLQLANSLGTMEEKNNLGIRLERQAEIWVEQGLNDQARAAFKLLLSLTLPFPEPYFRMGEIVYYKKFDFNIPYVQIYEMAVNTKADSARDNDFKAMSHTRLCEYYLESPKQSLLLAEDHCKQALELGTFGVFSGEFNYLAQMLLGRVLSGQKRYAESYTILKNAINQYDANANYKANAMYNLAFYVYEAQSFWPQALEIYRQVINIQASESYTQAARIRMVNICSEHVEPVCSTP